MLKVRCNHLALGIYTHETRVGDAIDCFNTRGTWGNVILTKNIYIFIWQIGKPDVGFWQVYRCAALR